MKFRTALLCAALASVSSLGFAAKPATPDLVIAPAAKGGDKIEISFDDKHVYVTAGAVDVVGQASKGSRFYRKGTAGEALLELKDEGAGFKLRNPAEKLVWKVKFDGDKIKIADNEEMKNAWSLRMHPDHIKVSDAKDAELGEVKMNKDTGKIKVKDAKGKELYVIESGKLTAAAAVLLLKDIPEQQRDILAGELFVHGK